ncbi:MAG: synthase delta subunit [Pseudomonadota bacterium]|jgi:F-type H+-transporting ATPase subunit delta
MSELITLARPYAVAAYRRAKETQSVQQWADQLALLQGLLADDRLHRAAVNPAARKDVFTDQLIDLCGAHLDQEGANFVRILVSNGRLSLISSILQLFNEYRAADEGYADVDVISAYPLAESETVELAALINTWLAREGRLNVTVDGSLIAGVVLRAGGRVVDASVRGQLQRLAQGLGN